LKMQGLGVLALKGNNTFAGPLTITEGTVEVESAAAFGDASSPTNKVIIDGGTLSVVGSGFSAGQELVVGSGHATLFTDGDLTLTGTLSTTASPTTTTAGMLIKQGEGTLTLAGNGGTTGLTIEENSGTVEVTGDYVFGRGTTTVRAGSTFIVASGGSYAGDTSSGGLTVSGGTAVLNGSVNV